MTAFITSESDKVIKPAQGSNRKQRRQNKKYERYINTDREYRIHRGWTKSNKPKK